MKIEDGKHYKTRLGKVVGPMRTASDSTHPMEDPMGRRWRVDGLFIGAYPSKFDLVEECVVPTPADDRDVKKAIIDRAGALVTGDRRKAYGTPTQNFERIARFWQAYFENTGRGDIKITAADISPLMRLTKEARLCESPGHADSFVDIVGYALTGAEVNGVDAAEL